jgi:hypothetical protein
MESCHFAPDFRTWRILPSHSLPISSVIVGSGHFASLDSWGVLSVDTQSSLVHPFSNTELETDRHTELNLSIPNSLAESTSIANSSTSSLTGLTIGLISGLLALLVISGLCVIVCLHYHSSASASASGSTSACSSENSIPIEPSSISGIDLLEELSRVNSSSGEFSPFSTDDLEETREIRLFQQIPSPKIHGD